MSPVDVVFDVAGEEGGEKRVAAWVFVPATGTLTRESRMFACIPGGSYSKRYYHLEIAGHSGYSMGQSLADQGHVVLALDPLGVGDSTHPEPEGGLTAAEIARASDLAVRQAVSRLRNGTLIPGMGPQPQVLCVGVGHSMGGMLVTLQQADHRTFDALAILGFSTFQLDQATLTAAVKGMTGGDEDRFADLANYIEISREGMHDLFYYSDVPEAVIDADIACAVPLVKEPALLGLYPTRIAAQTRSLDVPLFLGFAEVDVSQNPRGELANYVGTSDITLHLLPSSAHCANLASTRQQLWDRLSSWASSLPS
jgi:pimeloyl-ACP methyl ester carboxylesterase